MSGSWPVAMLALNQRPSEEADAVGDLVVDFGGRIDLTEEALQGAVGMSGRGALRVQQHPERQGGLPLRELRQRVGASAANSR